MDASLWQLLSSHSNGDIYKFLDQIIQCIHTNTGSRIFLLMAEQTDTGFVSHQMQAGQNILGQEFSKYSPQLSGEWESFVRSLSESGKHKDDAPLLGEYDFGLGNQKKKSQLRKFFHDMLEKKMASKGLKFARLPWGKLCSDSESYILPGCLPYGFQLKDPELLRVEEVAELWKFIYQHQQSDELTALHFTDEVFKFDRSMREPEKKKKRRMKGLERKGGSRPLGISKKVGQQTAARIKPGNGEADKPDDVFQNKASLTPVHNTEVPGSNPEPFESIKRPKRKAPTLYVEDSFENRPRAPKRRKPSAADPEDLDLDSESDYARTPKKNASTRCVVDPSSDSSPGPESQAPDIENPVRGEPDLESEPEASSASFSSNKIRGRQTISLRIPSSVRWTVRTRSKFRTSSAISRSY